MKLPPLQGALWLCCTVVPVLWGPHFQHNLQKKKGSTWFISSRSENDWTNQRPFRRERRGQNQHKWCAHHYLQCAGWNINSLSGCFYCIHKLWKQYWTVELRWTVRFLTEPRPSSYRASKYQKLGHLSTKKLKRFHPNRLLTFCVKSWSSEWPAAFSHSPSKLPPWALFLLRRRLVSTKDFA